MINGSVLDVTDIFPALEEAYRSGRRAPLNLSRLLLDIRATFPSLLIALRPIRRRAPGAELVWMIASSEAARMPDGLPFFMVDDDAGYSDGIHTGFGEWFAARGWYLERYSTAWYVPTRLPTVEDRAQWEQEALEYRAAQIGPPTPGQMDPCPF